MTTSWWRSGASAKKFMPHQFGHRVELTAGLPRVLLTRDVYEDMFVLVDECQQEVGWLGVVERIGRDFLIKEVFLFDQEVHGTTCEITPNGLADFATEILSNRPDGMEVVNSLRFWGHSHVNMGTSPSGQDESQLLELAEQGEADYFIRAILNKDGRIEFTILLKNIGVMIRDAVWELYEPADEQRRARWQSEIQTKVREKVYPTFPQPDFGYSRVQDVEPVSVFKNNGGSRKAKGGYHRGR